jgi:hypothetical protein
MSRLLCLIGLHRWQQWGGTRVGNGLFCRCQRCNRLMEGVEGRRCIYWIDVDASSRRRAEAN